MLSNLRKIFSFGGKSSREALARQVDSLERSLARSDAILDVLLFDTEFSPSPAAGMNGQEGRKRIVEEMFGSLAFENIVETGTFFGMTAGYLSSAFGIPVSSCEAVKRHFYVSTKLLRNMPGINVTHSDSRAFLRNRALDETVVRQMTFFYLDAHWHEDLPLADEVAIIASAWTDFVVMIDDFKVPGDPGYLYDDYGRGKTLDLGYLRPLLAQYNLDAYFPVLPSSQETGKKRGCVIVAPHRLCSKLSGIESLRKYDAN